MPNSQSELRRLAWAKSSHKSFQLLWASLSTKTANASGRKSDMIWWSPVRNPDQRSDRDLHLKLNYSSKKNVFMSFLKTLIFLISQLKRFVFHWQSFINVQPPPKLMRKSFNFCWDWQAELLKMLCWLLFKFQWVKIFFN